MEPEGSLPHSQVPATCPYPEPDRSSPYPHTKSNLYEGWNFNSGNYLFTTDTK